MDATVKNKKCFVCDKESKDSKKIIRAATSFTSTLLVDKLQTFVGQNFVVVVNEHDCICENCAILFDEIDKLECNLKNMYKVLRIHLVNKYALIFSNENRRFNEKVSEKEKGLNRVSLNIKNRVKKCSRRLKVTNRGQKVSVCNKNSQNATFFCNICKMGLLNRSELTRHISQKHVMKKDNLYACKVCSQQFSSEKLCQNHIESCHMNELETHNMSNIEASNHDSVEVNVDQDVLSNDIISSNKPCIVKNVGNYDAIKNVEISVVRSPDTRLELDGIKNNALPRLEPYLDCSSVGKVSDDIKMDDCNVLESSCNKALHLPSNETTRRGGLKNNVELYVDELDGNVNENRNNTDCSVDSSKKPVTFSRSTTTCDDVDNSNVSVCTDYKKPNNESMFCVVCKKMFQDYNSLSSHMIEHPNRNDDNCCSSCYLNFNNKSELISHIKCAHLQEKLCTICGKSFKKQALFLNHVEYKHRSDLLCVVCEKEFNDLKKLIAHEKKHNKKEFRCDICCKVLKTYTSLKVHMIAKHTRDYPFICEVCGKGFISSHSLNDHKGKHSNESRYICDICGKGYRLYDTYYKHRNHHDNPYPKHCVICNQHFRSSSRLAEHKRKKHTLECPYKCPHCPKSFYISSLLKYHLCKHTRQYPFTCTICKKGFPSRIKYATHLSKKHKDDSLIKNRNPNNKERLEEWLKCSRKN